MLLAVLLALMTAVVGKELVLFPRQDVYVEKQRPTWSYRTSVLQVGKTDSPSSEHRAFLRFDLSTVAASRARVVSAKLRLHPLLASPNARLTHHACLLTDVTWRSDEVSWEAQPDGQCRDRSAPCCGNAIGSWQPRPSQPSEVELTYYVKRAMGASADRLLALHLYAPTAASTREHYYVQYGSSRRADASTRPELVLDVIAPTSARESTVDGKGLYRALAGSPATFTISARDAEGLAQAAGGDDFHVGLVSSNGASLNASVADTGNGTYSVYYTPTVAGLYKLDVTLGGRAVGDAPFTTHIVPAPTAPAHCIATGAGLFEGVAGAASSFVITPRDSFGNARPLESNDVFTVFVARLGAAAGHPHTGVPSAAVLKWQPAIVSDLRNGTYEAEYTVKEAGAYVVRVQLGGIHIMGSPFQATILPSRTNARASSATGGGLRKCTAGVPTSFSIVARDEFGNARSVCGDDFDVTLVGPETSTGSARVHGVVSESGNGTYVVEYTVTSAGLYYVSITLAGRHVKGSPYAMQALPAEARASHTSAFGEGLASTTAGNLTEIFILAKDTYGNAEHTSTGGNITVSLSGPEEITAKVVDSLTGVYTASYTPRKAGSYAVSILYNQLPIFGSPYTTVVRPGRAHALTSVIPCLGVQGTPASDDVVDGCAAAVGIAGEVNSFAVRARDSSGNDCVTGGELVEAVLLQAPAASNTPNMRAFIEGTRGAGLKATVLDTTDGAYSITYRTLAAGAYQLSITIEGAHIRGSPFQVVVKPGATCADKSMVEGGGRSSATAGETTPLLIRAVDCYGNTQTEGGDPFSVTLMRPGVSPLMADVLDLSDGRYSVSYNATISGLWQLHVTTNGVHAIGSPFHVLVEPGPTSAHATIAVGEGTQRAPIGEPTSVIVRTKDMLGNDRAIGGDRISATLTQAATSSVVHASVRDTRDGSYTLTYTLTLTSWQTDYLLVVKVNNESIGGSPYRVKPVPGPTVCDQSISISEPTCIAGAVSEAPIFAKDRLGNQRSSGGDVFTASLELLEAPYNNESVQVGDNGDGSYKAMWVVTRAAHHKLWIAGRCGPIKGSPYSVHCKPGALSVSHSQLYGAAATDAIAGAKSVFYVRARDVFDNTLLEGSYRWGASLTASAGSWTVEQALVHGRHELERGSFGLHYNVTKAGTYELVVGALGVDGRVNASMQVQGSPTVVTVRAGPLCGRRSKVFGPTAANGAAEGSPEGDASPDGAWVEGAGRPVRLWIEARDAHDNPHESAIEPAPFRIVVRRKGGGRLATPAALVKAASKGGVGAYTADLVLPKTGSYLVDVVAEPSRTLVGAEGGELRGSPYPLRIVPGPTSAFQSTADGGGLSSFTARVGALQWVLITARDMYGNARSHGGDRFSLILSGPNGTRLTASSMVDYANGTYVGSYLATVAGNYSISVQRADEAGVWWDIKGSPFSVSIASGPTNPFVSRLVGAHEVSAGEQTAFNLMSRDEFGNAPVGGERHRFSVSAVPRSTGVPLPIAQLLDAGRGNYTVLHVFSQAGEYVVRTALLGQGGGTLPDFPLRVSPGALSPSHCELLWPCHAPKCVEAASRRQGYFVGWPVRFSVLPFDAYGNRRPDAGRTATFVARVHGPRAAAAYSQLRCAGASAVPNDDGTSALHCRAEQRADGLYVVEFVPLVRGEFVVNVSVYAGAYGSRKLGNLPGKMVVQVDAAPVATCARFRNCTDHGVCNFLTGRCVCDAGWDGDDCSHGASIRRSCPSDCSNHGYCSDETDAWGRNVCRCAVDYAGADCATWVSKIVVPEVTGPECPNECSGHGACNATCGECACEPGWRGDDCSVSGEHFITALAKDALGRQLVLDFSPSTRRFGVYAVHKGLSDEGRLECAGLDAKPLCSGTWPVVLDAASSGSWARPFLFTSLGNGMLLQYEPTHGAYLLLGCDGSCEGGLPCSRRLAAGRCSDAQLPLGPSMRASYIGLDSLLFHNGATGAYTVHRIARSFLEQSSSGCLFDPPIAASTWPEVGIHRHTWLGVHDLLVDYEPARGNYTVWRFDRAAQGDDRVSLGVVTRGHLMATSRQFVALGDGQLLLAADGAAHSASTVAGELPSAGGDAYEMWACSTSDDAYSPSDALPCLPIGHADGLGRPHACPLGCAAGDCACASKASCLAQAGCGWCADTGAGVCTAGDAGGPAAAVGGGSECFAWSYTTERTVAGASAYEPHSYAYVEGAMLLDYSAADGKYKLWNVANPPRPGCPGVQWPPTASGTLAVTRHSLAAVPLGTERAFGLVDYEPKSGDFRLGSCNRSATVSAGHLDCRTSTNGTWHTGGFQLLWVGGKTVMRYSKATGQYTLWTYTTAQSAHAFEATPAADGALLRADGQRLVGASLTYLDAGELLATVPSSGLVALYRRSSVPTTLSAASWSLQPEEGVVMTDGFEHRWESQTVLRGWQFAYVGRQMLMMLKPSSGAYRLLNCSAVYTSSSTLPRAAVAAGLAGGPPCPLVVEGSLPHKAPCEHSREQCLLAPQCGWCQSTDKCVSANEDGVCSGHCPDGQLLYSTAPSSYASQQGASRAEYGAECSAQLACDRCTEQPSCAWCTAAGGQCIRSIDGKMGECRTGKLVAHDSSKCPLVEEADFTGLVGQVE